MEKREALNFIIGSLISADSCLTIKDCQNNIKALNKFKDEIKNLDWLSEEDLELYNNIIEDSIQINLNEIKKYENNSAE